MTTLSVCTRPVSAGDQPACRLVVCSLHATGGTIAIGKGNLTFSGGNTALGDNIVVNGGKGTVFNDDPLMIAATWAMLAIGFLGLGRAKTEEGVGEIGLGQRFCQLRFGRWWV